MVLKLKKNHLEILLVKLISLKKIMEQFPIEETNQQESSFETQGQEYTLSRRDFMRGAALSVAAAALSGCGSSPVSAMPANNEFAAEGPNADVSSEEASEEEGVLSNETSEQLAQKPYNAKSESASNFNGDGMAPKGVETIDNQGKFDGCSNFNKDSRGELKYSSRVDLGANVPSSNTQEGSLTSFEYSNGSGTTCHITETKNGIQSTESWSK